VLTEDEKREIAITEEAKSALPALRDELYDQISGLIRKVLRDTPALSERVLRGYIAAITLRIASLAAEGEDGGVAKMTIMISQLMPLPNIEATDEGRAALRSLLETPTN
jgi:hypothetical protein